MPYDLSLDLGRIVQAVQAAPSVFNTRPWWLEFHSPDRIELWLRAGVGEHDSAVPGREYSGTARARERGSAAWARERGSAARARERGSAARARERGSAAQARVPDGADRARRRDRVAMARAREYVISCGAALFNLRLAIRMAGHEPVVWLLPEPAYADPTHPPALLASVEIVTQRTAKPRKDEQELYEAIWRRHTNRWPYAILPAPLPILVAMEDAALREGAYLRLLEPRQARRCLRLAAEADRDPAFRSPFPNLVSRANYGPTPGHGEPVIRKDFRLDGVKRRFERKPQLMALSTDDDQPIDWLRAGQALERAILTGTRYSVSAPYGRAAKYYAPYLYGFPARHHRLAPDELAPYGLSASFLTQPLERYDVEGQYRRWPWPWRFPELPQMLLRVGYAAVQTPGEAPPKTDMAAVRSLPSGQPPRHALPNSASELRTGT